MQECPDKVTTSGRYGMNRDLEVCKRNRTRAGGVLIVPAEAGSHKICPVV